MKFKKGDFIKSTKIKGLFAIYEGNEIKEGFPNTTKYSLLLYYDPKHQVIGKDFTSKEIEYIEATTDTETCTYTISTDEENLMFQLCDRNEQELCRQIMDDFGLIWDDFTQKVIDTINDKPKETNPKSYDGRVITPISQEKENELLSLCKKSIKTPSYSTPYYMNPYYMREYGNRYNYDYYD